MSVVPFQCPGLFERTGLTFEECAKEAWAIEPDGTRHHGAGAMLTALAWSLGVPGAGRVHNIPVLHVLFDALYATIVRLRAHLPGTTPYCVRFPEQCGRQD